MPRRAFPLLVGLLPVLVLADLSALWVGFALRPRDYVAFWTVLALAAATSAIPHGRRAVIAGGACFALIGAVLFAYPCGSSKQFYRAAAALESGLSRAEVALRLSRCMYLTDDVLLRSHEEDRESWYSDPWFAVCDVVYDGQERVAQVSTFAFDSPFGGD